MNSAVLLVGGLMALCYVPSALGLQQQIWDPQTLSLQQYPPTQQRQPIAAELQNQVNALSAQLAAAGRQLEYFRQQLALNANPQAQARPQQPQLHQPQAQVVSIPQQQPQPQAQFQYQPQTQAQQQALQYYNQQPAEQPQVSTLVDEPETARHASQAQSRVFFQQQQAQQFVQQPGTSTTASPASIEPSLVIPAQAAAPAQAPNANMAPPHNPPRNDDKFSIGLGVLSPGYTQKFGNTALDFNQDKNGFSFTLSNNGHNNQVPQVTKPSAASESSQAV